MFKKIYLFVFLFSISFIVANNQGDNQEVDNKEIYQLNKLSNLQVSSINPKKRI